MKCVQNNGMRVCSIVMMRVTGKDGDRKLASMWYAVAGNKNRLINM